MEEPATVNYPRFDYGTTLQVLVYDDGSMEFRGSSLAAYLRSDNVVCLEDAV